MKPAYKWKPLLYYVFSDFSLERRILKNKLMAAKPQNVVIGKISQNYEKKKN